MVRPGPVPEARVRLQLAGPGRAPGLQAPPEPGLRVLGPPVRAPPLRAPRVLELPRLPDGS